jgi:hypothetical protein
MGARFATSVMFVMRLFGDFSGLATLARRALEEAGFLLPEALEATIFDF